MAEEFSDTAGHSSCAAVEEALENPLILDHIFQNLSTKLLLSSCSLVNKIWLKEASKRIRNHRQCQAAQTSGKNACEFLQQFDCLIGEMARHEDGRTIPFNGLKVIVFGPGEECPLKTSPDEFDLENLTNAFNLKYLHVEMGQHDRDCHIHHPLTTIFRHNGSQLQSLKLSYGITFLTQLFHTKEWDLTLVFPALEVLDISDVFMDEERDLQDEKETLEKLFSAAPKLKRVAARNVDQLKLIPMEMLPSLQLQLREELDFRMKLNQDLALINIISAQSTSNIKTVNIYVPPFAGQTVQDDTSEDEPVDLELRRSFDIACQRMLNTCHASLEEISIHGVFPLGQLLRLPPLNKISKFNVFKRYPAEMPQLWDAISTIDYERLMPGLEQVQIIIQTCFHSPRIDFNDPDFCGIWPPNNDAVHNSSTTVRQLTVDVQVLEINLRPLQAVFPNLSILHLELLGTRDTMHDFAPLSDIWKYFAGLEELKIYVADDKVYRSHDPDFCGVNAEEVEFLGQQTEGYLSRLHIVPLRPAIITMTKLRKLELQFEYEDRAGIGDCSDRVFLVSKITRLVAFNRMPQLEVSIPRYLKSIESN